MSDRGFRGSHRGGGNRGRGHPRGRGQGYRKRPPPDRSHGPPHKLQRGGVRGRGGNHNPNYGRGPDTHYEPQMATPHNYQEPRPSTSRDFIDRGDHYPHDQMPYDMVNSGPSNRGSGPMNTMDLVPSALPKPIPALREDFVPDYDSRFRDDRPRSNQPPAMNIPNHDHYRPNNDYHYGSPPPPSPPPPPPPPQDYGDHFAPRGGPRVSSRSRGGRGDGNFGNSYRGGPPQRRYPSPPRSNRRGHSPSRGRGRASPSRGGRGGGSSGPYRGSSGPYRGSAHPSSNRKPSALSRLGPVVNDRAVGNRGRGRGGSMAPKMRDRTPEPSTSNDANQANPDKRFVFLENDALVVICRHCGFRTSDWAGYKTHLATQTHTSSLRGLKNKLHQSIGSLRNTQRRKQNLLTKKMEAEGSLYDEQGQRKATLFCKLCKLIFNQSRESHNDSADHKNIHSFLNPTCAVCDLHFKTPMSYEKHLCSVKHLQNELDPESAKTNADKEDEEVQSDEDFDFNPDELVTLDEVGENDDDDEAKEEEEVEDEEKIEKEETNEQEEEKREERLASSEEITMEEEVKEEEMEGKCNPVAAVGHDYVRQVVMFYCDLCHKYLPKMNPSVDPDELIDDHCASSAHQNAYVKKEAEKRMEEHQALKMLAEEEEERRNDDKDSSTHNQSLKKTSFNEDQLDYEAESGHEDGKSEASEK